MFGEQENLQPTFEVTIDQDNEELHQLLQTPGSQRRRSTRKSVAKTPIASVEDDVSEEELEGEPMQLQNTPALATISGDKNADCVSPIFVDNKAILMNEDVPESPAKSRMMQIEALPEVISSPTVSLPALNTSFEMHDSEDSSEPLSEIIESLDELISGDSIPEPEELVPIEITVEPFSEKVVSEIESSQSEEFLETVVVEKRSTRASRSRKTVAKTTKPIRSTRQTKSSNKTSADVVVSEVEGVSPKPLSPPRLETIVEERKDNSDAEVSILI